MIIYKDRYSGDELFTDVYKITLINDVLYEVEGKLTTEVSGDVDDSAIGGNASAEGGEEKAEATSVSGVNIVLANRLVQTSYTKKDYSTHIKAYMKKLKGDVDPSRVATFQANAAAEVKKILENFKEWDFYYGESMDSEAMVPLLGYREDGVTPFMLFWKDGLEEEKV